MSSNHSEKAEDRVFGVPFGDDTEGTSKHGHDVDQEEQVGNAPRKVSMLLKVPQLVTPLSKDSQSVLKESNNNEEPGQGRHIRSDGLSVSLDHIFNLATPLLDVCKHLIVAEPLGLGWPGDGVRGVPAADAAHHRRLTRDVRVEVNALGHACRCYWGMGKQDTWVEKKVGRKKVDAKCHAGGRRGFSPPHAKRETTTASSPGPSSWHSGNLRPDPDLASLSSSA